MNALITLRVPATSANLGSGFDTIGMAVSLYNIFKVTELLPEGEYKVEALGEGARELSSPNYTYIYLRGNLREMERQRPRLRALVPQHNTALPRPRQLRRRGRRGACS